jgi:hypothetical protein
MASCPPVEARNGGLLFLGGAILGAVVLILISNPPSSVNRLLEKDKER